MDVEEFKKWLANRYKNLEEAQLLKGIADGEVAGCLCLHCAMCIPWAEAEKHGRETNHICCMHESEVKCQICNFNFTDECPNEEAKKRILDTLSATMLHMVDLMCSAIQADGTA